MVSDLLSCSGNIQEVGTEQGSLQRFWWGHRVPVVPLLMNRGGEFSKPGVRGTLIPPLPLELFRARVTHARA